MISYTGKDCPGAVKTAGFKKMLLYQGLFAPLMINSSFSVCERHLLENNPMKLMRLLQECYVQTLMITNYKIASIFPFSPETPDILRLLL